MSSKKCNSSQTPRIKCRFDLSDPVDCDALRWVQSFHCQRGIYRLIDICRGDVPGGKRTILMLTRAQVRQRSARPEWLVIEYSVASSPSITSVMFCRYPTLRGARNSLQVALAHLNESVDGSVPLAPT